MAGAAIEVNGRLKGVVLKGLYALCPGEFHSGFIHEGCCN